jgi:hypothetical protein
VPGLGNRPYGPLSNNAEIGRNSLGASDLKHNLQRRYLVHRAHLGPFTGVGDPCCSGDAIHIFTIARCFLRHVLSLPLSAQAIRRAQSQPCTLAGNSSCLG